MSAKRTVGSGFGTTVGAAILSGALLLPAASVGQRGVSGDLEVAGLLDGIEAGSAKQERLEREAASLGARREQTRGSLRSQVRALYRITRSGLSPMAGGFDAVLRHVARVRRLQRIVRREAQALNGYEQRAQTLRVERAQVAQELERARTRLSALQNGPSPDQGLMGLLPRGEAGYRPGDQLGHEEYGLRLVDSMPSEGFAAQRGRLASPITGDVRIVAAQRAESDGPGLELQAEVGTAVRAAAAGRVAFSDRYGSYGRLVILDHGDGFYTVYGGLGAVEVRVGDDLSREARIGSVGTDYSPSALFFEVRKGTRTLDPRSWLGL